MDGFDRDDTTFLKRRIGRRDRADAPPDAPPDWRSRILELLARPDLDPMDARSLRGWLAWGKLPASYWKRVQEITEQINEPLAGQPD